MEIRTGYRNNEKYRNSFTALAGKVFGLNLGSWYDNGFWQDDYIPYSVIEGDSVVSNISVNICNFKWGHRIHHLAQLGTVMTDSDHRGKGYSRAIMEKVLDDCDRSFEGVYLYAEEHMSGFYEKFGFIRTDEYRCTKKVNITSKTTAEKIPMETKEDWVRMVDIIQRKGQYGERVMVNNPGLFMFYISGPFSGSVYYIPSCEAYVVASAEGDLLTIYAVFCDEKISLGEVISSFGSGIKRVNMAFMPENNTGFEQKKIVSEDTILFTRGKAFENMKNERFMFPEISHA